MSVSVADATTLLENVLFESASLAATNAPGWVSQSSTNASESTVSGLAAAMAASPEAGIVQQVVRYYEGALGRAPAGFEILYYVNIVEAGLTASQISAGATSVPQTAWNQVASDFANSPEFSFATAGTNVVTLLYQNILGRTPGPAELAFYQAQIAAGYPDTILIQEFTNSPEFQASVDGNVSSALASFGTAAVAGSGLPLLPVKLPGQDVSVALGSSPVTVAGTSVVTTVTVTGLPAAAAARGYEDDRPLGLARCEHPGQLEQRGGAGQFRFRAARGRVAVGDDHDRRRACRSGPLRDDVLKRALAVDRFGLEAADVHREAPAGGASQPFKR